MALKICAKAGFDIRKAWVACAALDTVEKLSGEAMESAWLSTHPAYATRAQALRAEIASMQHHGWVPHRCEPWDSVRTPIA